MSFKDNIPHYSKEELLEEIIDKASEYETIYNDIDKEELVSLIRKKLECVICGALDSDNHDELSHKINSDYTGG